ncbi:MAG: hypoxanthine phosphoribosyltransferase [Bacteroidia bacterium]|jgi:hypoxanthine phosphoribosyltransferase|nr:hypoxanthine phosphoribosyltransferase [Bacteroidia bacterium]MCC6768795.1 hypoxanthine phosphoribosyltransferase [Bacteroidia bacterium]
MQKINVENMSFEMFISNEQINKRIGEIAMQLNQQFDGLSPVFISILNGSFMFTADLLKQVSIPCQLSFVKLASYTGISSSGQVKELVGLAEDIRDRHIIILEDIVDTGLTIHSIIDQLAARQPASIHVATLLQKPDCLKVEVPVDFIGFSIPDKFVIGYGLDLNGYARNLPDIYQLSNE